MMITANIGLITNFEIVKFNFMVLAKELMAIVNATKWHATDAHAAPLTPISGIGTKIKFKTSFANTPTT